MAIMLPFHNNLDSEASLVLLRYDSIEGGKYFIMQSAMAKVNH